MQSHDLLQVETFSSLSEVSSKFTADSSMGLLSLYRPRLSRAFPLVLPRTFCFETKLLFLSCY